VEGAGGGFCAEFELNPFLLTLRYFFWAVYQTPRLMIRFQNLYLQSGITLKLLTSFSSQNLQSVSRRYIFNLTIFYKSLYKAGGRFLISSAGQN